MRCESYLLEHLRRKKVRFNRSFSMKGAVSFRIICCIFANGFGYCHFQDIVGKQKKHSLLFRVQPESLRKLIGNNVNKE